MAAIAEVIRPVATRLHGRALVGDRRHEFGRLKARSCRRDAADRQTVFARSRVKLRRVSLSSGFACSAVPARRGPGRTQFHGLHSRTCVLARSRVRVSPQAVVRGSAGRGAGWLRGGVGHVVQGVGVGSAGYCPSTRAAMSAAHSCRRQLRGSASWSGCSGPAMRRIGHGTQTALYTPGPTGTRSQRQLSSDSDRGALRADRGRGG